MARIGLAGVLVDGVAILVLGDLVAGDVAVGALADPAQPGVLEGGEVAVHGHAVAFVDALAHGAGVEHVVHLVGPALVFGDGLALCVDGRRDGVDGGGTGVGREGLVPDEGTELGVPLVAPVVGSAEDGFAHGVWRGDPGGAAGGGDVGGAWDGPRVGAATATAPATSLGNRRG